MESVMKMMQRMVAVGLLALGLATTALAAPPSPDYMLLYEESFNGDAVNERDWTWRTGRRTGGPINGLNLKENVTVSGGALHIAVRQEMIDGKLENTGGGLISRHQFGYGYYETLSKPFMAGRGVHSSFWQAGGSKPNNSIFEIDSYEIDATSRMGCNNLYIHLATKDYKEVPWPHRANVPFTLQPGGWLLDGYEYTPEGVTFYDNGKVVAKAEWAELTAAQAVWLTALNGCGKVDGDKLPGETTFEYFRYYAKDYPGVNLLPNGNFEYNQDKTNPTRPIAWQQQGTAGAGRVTEGEASLDRYKLRHAGTDGPYDITTRQSLEYIMNGDYELSAMVRSSGGQALAQMRASDFGGEALTLDIPASARWTRVSIPKVAVTSHGVTIAISSRGAPGQWLEIDDVQFKKPDRTGQMAPVSRPFVLIGDPIWHLARKESIAFSGNEKFYFFDRNVGIGDALTVSFIMEPELRANMSPIARIPRTGQSGWAVQLADTGDLIFRIGSGASHRDVIANDAYAAGKPCRVTCTFSKGVASIFVNGALLKTESEITQDTRDATAAGRLGSVGETYQAVGDVIVKTEPASAAWPSARNKRNRNYVGSLRDVRIYNRALSATEIAKLETPEEQDLDLASMIQPVPVDARFHDPGYNVWCGSPVRGDDGKFHLFYSRWPRELSHKAWVTHSEVAHAVADNLFGPYKFADVALPARGKQFWDGLCTHNPMVIRIRDKYVIYYMGNTGDGVVQKPLNMLHRNNQRIGVAVADKPEGPWQRFDKPVLDVSSDPGAPDALMVSNPAATERPDGGVLLVYKAVAKKEKLPGGGPVVHLVATSDSPTGPFKKMLRPIFTKPGLRFAAEDPCIWHDGVRYHAVVKDNAGYFTGQGYSLALFESADGQDWRPSRHVLVTSPKLLRWTDGQSHTLTALERPFLYRKNGRPLALFCAAADREDRDNSFNLQIPLQVR